MNCENVKEALSLFLYGELSLEEEQALQDHLETCGECRQALETERSLHEALDARALEPSPDLVTGCRRELRLRLKLEAHERSWPARLRAWLAASRDRLAVLQRPAAALALVALGFFGARWTSRPPALQPAESAVEAPVARIRFVEPDSKGGVRIALEETRQRVITGRPDEEPIQRLLVAASREAADPGLRLESVDLLRTRAEHEAVRRALLDVVEHDANPGVRLKALEALKPFASQAEVRQALARVLLEDQNPGVRIQAIDLLIQQPAQEALIGVLQELLNKEDNSYVRLRSQRALQQLNASAGTF